LRLGKGELIPFNALWYELVKQVMFEAHANVLICATEETTAAQTTRDCWMWKRSHRHPILRRG
jgi:hypothetical protein